MAEFDKKGRSLTQQQLAAIFAKANKSGISDRQLNKTVLTSLNDEILVARRNKATDPIATGINSIIAKRIVTVKPKKVKDVIEAVAKTNAITKQEARRELESSNVIIAGISDEAVVGSSSEAQFNQIKKNLETNKIKKIEREIITEQVKKEQKGTVAAKPKISRTQLEALRNKIKLQQERGEIRDKIIAQQDKLEIQRKQLESRLRKELAEKVRVNPNGVPIGPTVKGATTGVSPLEVEIREAKDKQFQLQKKAFELRQLGFSPRLAEERAKIILNQ